MQSPSKPVVFPKLPQKEPQKALTWPQWDARAYAFTAALLPLLALGVPRLFF